ncbi:hypothetical protein [Bradyrhizobium sp. 172]|uniref:hypothetical protein n=1 Tax=Bradyrhizobium sp. 172 TaxID=2782643 RepID=UPI001FFF508B|nr:hypothetical protein [Bradyrhizobium sp. 172]UPJ94921.1 hypothetical protein IVB07_31795 [Bradyrhizobium sp. 172]
MAWFLCLKAAEMLEGNKIVRLEIAMIKVPSDRTQSESPAIQAFGGAGVSDGAICVQRPRGLQGYPSAGKPCHLTWSLFFMIAKSSFLLARVRRVPAQLTQKRRMCARPAEN